MCGIAGFMSARMAGDQAERDRVLRAMTDAVRERGPDGAGYWLDADRPVGLGHRRLSIQDPSDQGAQPMASACGRYLLTFNGEIYDFKPLGDELRERGVVFRGGSDSEVLLAAIVEFGFEKTLERIDGMFAFAVYDREEGCLLLARDPLGKKPLYYTSDTSDTSGALFLFGSKLSALAQHPEFEAEIDRDALSRYLQVGWIPCPHTIYRGVRKLPPGSAMRVEFGKAPGEPWRYWSAESIAREGLAKPFAGSFEEACDEVEAGLRRAVDRRLVSDVEVAGLLSGGVDSSLVVGFAQQARQTPLRTYAIGFDDERFDESPFAKEIADHFGTLHTELTVRPGDVLERLPDLVRVFDEPLADPSALPTLVLSDLVGKDVKVTLSGDGGDEVFAGYPRFVKMAKRWHDWNVLPRPARQAIESTQHALDRGGSAFFHALSGQGELPGFVRALSPKLRPMGASGLEDYYLRSHERFRSRDGMVLGAGRTLPLLCFDSGAAPIGSDLQQLLYLDLMTFLADDILVKVDRASMSAGLEVRSPLLDTNLLRLAWSLPDAYRIDDKKKGKRVLRALLAREVPRKLVDRPKQGFNMPIADWMKGPLAPMIEDLLDENRLAQQGFFDPGTIRRIWREHQSGWRSHRNLLWSLIVFQLWHQEFHS